MNTKRGAEIERFYWLIINLLGKAFGYLMLIAGALFALGFLSEKIRTGAMTWNGREITVWNEQWPLLLGGTMVALLGLVLVRVLPINKGEKVSEQDQ